MEVAGSERLVAQSALGIGADATLRLLVATDALSNGGAERQLSLTLTNLPEQWHVRLVADSQAPRAQSCLLERQLPRKQLRVPSWAFRRPSIAMR